MVYRSEFFAFHQNQPLPVVMRNYTEADFEQLVQIQAECFPAPFPEKLWWNKEQLHSHITMFPKGAVCVEVKNELAGSITSLCVDFDSNQPLHTWADITNEGYIRNHNEKGDTLYVVDISIRPKYRKFGLGQWMMHALYQLVVEQKRIRLLGGGRMPGYRKVSASMTAEKYVESVIRGELTDPVITFLLKCGRRPVEVVQNYLEDAESLNYAVLMEWKNPFNKSLA